MTLNQRNVNTISKVQLRGRDAAKLIIIAAIVVIAAGYLIDRQAVRASINSVDPAIVANDKLARSAFTDAAKVFFSPRCANCHPAGDVPTQGDTMIVHSMNVKRGPDGRGVGEQKCAV